MTSNTWSSLSIHIPLILSWILLIKLAVPNTNIMYTVLHIQVSMASIAGVYPPIFLFICWLVTLNRCASSSGLNFITMWPPSATPSLQAIGALGALEFQCVQDCGRPLPSLRVDGIYANAMGWDMRSPHSSAGLDDVTSAPPMVTTTRGVRTRDSLGVSLSTLHTASRPIPERRHGLHTLATVLLHVWTRKVCDGLAPFT